VVYEPGEGRLDASGEIGSLRILVDGEGAELTSLTFRATGTATDGQVSDLSIQGLAGVTDTKTYIALD